MPNATYQNPSHEERFYCNVVDLSKLIEELITICYENGYKYVHPSLVKLATMVISGTNKTTIMENFIFYSYPYWEKIAKREESFFLENCKNVFKDLPLDKVDAFKVLFTAVDSNGTPIINDEDRCGIWDFFEGLIRICIKYIHEKRKPKLKSTPEGTKRVYETKFFPDINLQRYATLWKVELKWD